VISNQLSAQTIANSFKGAKQGTKGFWNFRCPFHEDDSPSAYVVVGRNGYPNGGCNAGCPRDRFNEEFKRLGFWPKRDKKKDEQWAFVENYDYEDERGIVIFRKTRWLVTKQGKTRKAFTQHKHLGDGKFAEKRDDARKVLYRVPKIKEATGTGGIVHLVEGEKDVHTLESWGLTATTAPDGGGQGKDKWDQSYTESLIGAGLVIMVLDDDDAGNVHFPLEVLPSLLAAGIEAVTLVLDKKDVTDWKNAGHSLDEFQSVCTELARTVDHAYIEELRKLQDEIKTRKVEQQQTPERAEMSDSWHYTIALQTIEHFGEGNLIFYGGRFYSWNGGPVWIECPDATIEKQIIGSCNQLRQLDKVRKSLLDSVKHLIKIQVTQDTDPFERTCETVIVKNGELSYSGDRWQLGPHIREHHAISFVPVNYDPDAEAPLFKLKLDEIFGIDDDRIEKVECIQERFGYALQTGCEYETFFLDVGGGSNGKGKLVYEPLMNLLGASNYSAIEPCKLDERFQIVGLFGKLANFGTEIRSTRELSSDTLKKCVSGEPVQGERKGRDTFLFRPYAKHFYSTNKLPPLEDSSYGFFRRVIITRYNMKFMSHAEIENDGLQNDKTVKLKDPHLPDKLKSELPGILNFALEGLARLRNRGGFLEPQSSKSEKEKWKAENDHVLRWLQRYKFGDFCSTKCDDVHADYVEWCQASNIRALIKDSWREKLKTAVSEKCSFTKDRLSYKSNGEWKYHGLELDYSKAV
jgi:putative DNA primase/helicase